MAETNDEETLKQQGLEKHINEFFEDKYKHINIHVDLSYESSMEWSFHREKWNANPKEYIYEIEKEIEDFYTLGFFKVSYFKIHFGNDDSKNVCGDEEVFNKYMDFIRSTANKYTRRSRKMNEVMEEELYLDLTDIEVGRDKE